MAKRWFIQSVTPGHRVSIAETSRRQALGRGAILDAPATQGSHA